jgi:polysaccharide export outer membrane protein
MIKRIPKLLSTCIAAGEGIVFSLLLACCCSAQLHAQQQTGSGQGAQLGQPHGGAAAGRSAAGSVEALAPEGIANLRLSPGSMVSVQVFEEPDLNGNYRLDSSGAINLPLGGEIPLATLTLPEAETAIAARLISAEILKMAHVVVNIAEYNAGNVIVLGEVASPGRVSILTGRTLKEILALAGGLTPLAGNEIVVHRANQPSDVTETIHDHGGINDQAAMDVSINPGDSVLVRKTGVVYVLGAVIRPGGYAMQESGELNVVEAIALALGTTPQASTNKTRVLRKGPDGTLLEISTLYDKVTKGQVVPLQLHAEDIVFVPNSAVKATLGLIQSELNSAATATTYYGLEHP